VQVRDVGLLDSASAVCPRRAGPLRADRSEDRRTLLRAGVTAVLAVDSSTAAVAQARW
jgi:hypothetical protein